MTHKPPGIILYSDKRPREVRRCVRRSGMALLLVLLILSVATVVSYAALRGQGTAVLIQENSNLGDDARRAAMTGLTYGIRAMHHESWTGVETQLSKNLAEHEKFTVSFSPGDASLAEGDADYGDYPYRVTVESTGQAEDPNNPDRIASYTVHAVMRLVPRALSDEPSDWSKMEGYTVYQTKKEKTELDLPCRIDGDFRLQGELKVGVNYLKDSPYRYKYFTALYSMSRTGYPDYRPFAGTVVLSQYEQNYYGYFIPQLYTYLRFDVQLLNSIEAASDWIKPQDLTSYQIYPGGPVYDIPQIGETEQDITLGPDVKTNPLGLYYCSSSKLEGNVTVHGTLFCKGSMEIKGANTVFQAVDLPALSGTDTPVRLPVLTANDVKVKPDSTTNIQGLAAVFGELLVEKSDASLPFSLQGRLVTQKLTVRQREQWENANWPYLYASFLTCGWTTLFPVYLESQGYSPVSKITFTPNSTPIQYHWNDWDNPIYVAHEDDDGGLRWEMLKWSRGAAP